MKDNSNYEIIENDAELEKLCTDSVELIKLRKKYCSKTCKYCTDNDLLFIR